MDAAQFVAELTRENEALLRRLDPAETLTAESGGDLSIANLLRVALKNEIEASEIAALWMPSAARIDLKIALARQAGDEAKHYRLIEARLGELGADTSGFNPLAEGYSPMFKFLSGLQSDIERVAAGQFTREAIALVKNKQFIELCERQGDLQTARLYRDIIQVDERYHQELGAMFLTVLANTEADRERARAARLRTIELADELQSLAYRARKIHHAPGC